MDTITLWDAIMRQYPVLKKAARATLYRRSHGSRLCAAYDAGDLLQDSVLKIIRNPAQVTSLGDNDSGLIALFYVTMNSVLTDWSRRPDIKHSSPTDCPQPPGSQTPEVLEKLDHESDKITANRAIEYLGRKAPTAAIALLYSLDMKTGDTYTAMAASIGLTENNYKQRRFDGIRTLRQRMCAAA